jgi:hypothetical protein
MMFSVVLLGGIALLVYAIILMDWLARRHDGPARHRTG